MYISDLQPRNALFPISSTVLGINTDSSVLQSANAFGAISVTVSPREFVCGIFRSFPLKLPIPTIAQHPFPRLSYSRL